MTSPTDIRLPQRHVERCMGTVFSLDVRAPGVGQAAIEAVVGWLHWADDTFSTYQRDSQISRLARGELTLDQCAPEVRGVLDRCVELAVETDGYFSAYANRVLDPSGLVKGWAIQRASEMLTAAGSRNHCVNGGGDVQCAGTPNPETPWRIGIAHPTRPGDLAAVVSGRDIAVATSGTAERGAHIRDPHTGVTPSDLASVTVVGAGLATVDAFATAAFAMGAHARDWLEIRTGHEALIVYPDGHRWSTAGFAAGK